MNERNEKKRVGRVKGTPNKPKYTAILKKYVDRQALIMANAWEAAQKTGRGPVMDGATLNAFYTGVIALEMVQEREKREKAARKRKAAAEAMEREYAPDPVDLDETTDQEDGPTDEKGGGRPTLLI